MSDLKNLKISLVIPAHNEEKYLGACLEHAIKNSGGKFHEIIVIDNASSDRTQEIAKKVPGVRVVREEKKGLVHARQRGFIEASGDVIAYIDADTRMPPEWFETVVNEIGSNRELASLSGPYVYYDISKWHQRLVKLYWYILALPAYFLIGYMTIGGNFVIRREVLEKMNGFDTSIAFYGEDTDIARRASKHGKVKFNPSFIMYSSGRRLSEEGTLKIACRYVLNFLSEVIIHRPATKKYLDIR